MKKLFLPLVVAFGLLLSVGFIAQPAFAADSAAKQQACESIQGTYDPATGNCTTGSGSSNPQDLVGNVITLFSWVVGAISVVMLIFAGFKYVTAAGDTAKITNAKNTILYALIGLVVVAFAQIIVNFVLVKSINSTKPATPKPAPAATLKQQN